MLESIDKNKNFIITDIDINFNESDTCTDMVYLKLIIIDYCLGKLINKKRNHNVIFSIQNLNNMRNMIIENANNLIKIKCRDTIKISIEK